MKNSDPFKNVVVLMLENRSFDNLLGYLYHKDYYKGGVPEGKKFEGLQNKSISNPVPERSIDYKEGKVVQVTKTEDYHQPYPDPGEEYQHVNSQIYNHVDPDNIGVGAHDMKPPYNIPQPAPKPPPMNGFVNDYINKLQALDGEDPKEETYGQIMQCFDPNYIPVLTTLAREFAVFDHWFCSVPSQTWCNRAFWHAATSGGKVLNAVGVGQGGIIDSIERMLEWTEIVWKKPTLFNRLKEINKSYTIYTELFPLTCVVNGFEYLKNTKFSFNDFLNDAKNGDLPDYSFIEPKIFGQHNDQHPSVFKPTRDGSVLLGEKLIWDVYNAVKTSPQRDETLLIITHDEHGGCFDHVAPPPAVPPVKDMKGELGFSFDRLGLRVPMVMISSYIEKNTIINDVHDHTSFIKTMSDIWGFEGLTDRDKNAGSFANVFSDKKRDCWPCIDMPIINEVPDVDYHHDHLNGLQKSILRATHIIAKNFKEEALKDLHQIEKVGEAIEHIEKTFYGKRCILSMKRYFKGLFKPLCSIIRNRQQ